MARKYIVNNVNVNPLSYISCDVMVKSQKLREIHVQATVKTWRHNIILQVDLHFMSMY